MIFRAANEGWFVTYSWLLGHQIYTRHGSVGHVRGYTASHGRKSTCTSENFEAPPLDRSCRHGKHLKSFWYTAPEANYAKLITILHL